MAYSDQILFNVTGQTLWMDAPEGVPSAITSVAVYENIDGDTGTAESATTGSASNVSNPDTTVDANSGAGQANPRKLNVAATDGLVEGSQFLITGAVHGETEWFEPVEVKSDDYIITRYPLHNAYVSGDAVQTTRVQISVDSTWVADKNNISAATDANPRYRVRWVYVIADSSTYVLDTYFDLVRYRGKHDVTPVDMENRYPGAWLNVLPTYSREHRGEDLIDQAYEMVSGDLFNEGYPQWAERNRSMFNELVQEKAMMVLRRSIYYADPSKLESYEIARRDYQELFDKRIRVTPRMKLTGDAAGAATTMRPQSITRR